MRGRWWSKNRRKTSAPRGPVPDFSKIDFKWSCTVYAAKCRWSAISLVERPRATCSVIIRSRLLKP